jgi:hypothetical protein
VETRAGLCRTVIVQPCLSASLLHRAGHALSASAALLGASLQDLDQLTAQVDTAARALAEARAGLNDSTPAAALSPLGPAEGGTARVQHTGDGPSPSQLRTQAARLHSALPAAQNGVDAAKTAAEDCAPASSEPPESASGQLEDGSVASGTTVVKCGSPTHYESAADTCDTRTAVATASNVRVNMAGAPVPATAIAAARAIAASTDAHSAERRIAALTASLASRDALLAQAQAALAYLQGEARGVAGQLREDAGTIESACDTLHVVINE